MRGKKHPGVARFGKAALILWSLCLVVECLMSLRDALPTGIIDPDLFLRVGRQTLVALLPRYLGYLAAILIVWACIAYLAVSRPRRRIRRLVTGSRKLTPQQFFQVRRPHGTLAPDFPGIYLIYNADRRRYYVGQAHQVLSRVNQHFTGRGNGDVYADYVAGDTFTIQLLALRGSGYHNLDDFERDAIETTHAYTEGYNKTAGNRPCTRHFIR